MKTVLTASLLLPLLLACGSEAADAPTSASAPQLTAPPVPPRPGQMPAMQPTGQPESRPTAPARQPTDVVAIVNGSKVLESDVEERFQAVVAEQTQGRVLSPEQMEHARGVLHDDMVKFAVNDRLFQQDAERLDVHLQDDDIRQMLETNIRGYLLSAHMTREELENRIQTMEKVSFDEYLKRQAEDPALRRALLQQKLVEAVYPQETSVDDTEVQERYESQLEERFSRPALVRASHILINPGHTPDEQAAARAKAEEVLALAKAPGADFAALARERSEGPTAPLGGDLGFFPREGGMVEPFAAAAFALDVGQISDVVQTQFGFHVIKCTAKEEPTVISLEEATEMLRNELKGERIAEMRETLVEDLRNQAKIEYPGGEKSKKSDETP
jgi:peptidyl-prolyl cis-trans isomerase C